MTSNQPTSTPTAAPTASFRTDPLRYFDQRLRTAGDTFWIDDRTLCVVSPSLAKAVLGNSDGLSEEHSDFFHTRRGPFGPRELQMALGGGARRLLSPHAATLAGSWLGRLERTCRRGEAWPDAGNRLLFDAFAPVLLTPHRLATRHGRDLGALLEQVLVHAVYAGARERRSRLRRAIFRRKLLKALTAEVEARAAERTADQLKHPRDLFDLLAAPLADERFPGVRADDLGELYLPFFFAVAGSVGFTVAWSLFLLAGSSRTAVDAPSSSIVRESLRLWPIAWQTGRRPTGTHRIGDAEVTPKTTVLVSAYASHRHPGYWSEPARFRPERWADPSCAARVFPFGWGPHTCAAASLSLDVASDVVDAARHRRLFVTPLTDRPFTGPSLAPPRFRLDLF